MTRTGLKIKLSSETAFQRNRTEDDATRIRNVATDGLTGQPAGDRNEITVEPGAKETEN